MISPRLEHVLQRHTRLALRHRLVYVAPGCNGSAFAAPPGRGARTGAQAVCSIVSSPALSCTYSWGQAEVATLREADVHGGHMSAGTFEQERQKAEQQLLASERRRQELERQVRELSDIQQA